MIILVKKKESCKINFRIANEPKQNEGYIATYFNCTLIMVVPQRLNSESENMKSPFDINQETKIVVVCESYE